MTDQPRTTSGLLPGWRDVVAIGSSSLISSSQGATVH